MNEFERHGPKDLPINSRLRRRAKKIETETASAIDLGRLYDVNEEAVESAGLRNLSQDEELVMWPVVDSDVADLPMSPDVVKMVEHLTEGMPLTESDSLDLEDLPIVSLDSDVRAFLADTGKVIDVGSIDREWIVNELGVDVCFNPGDLMLILRKAQEISGKQEVQTSDLVRARKEIDAEIAHGEQTLEALQDLKALGIDEDELLQLFETNPFRLRTQARLLLRSPVLADFVEALKTRVYRNKDRVYSLDEIMTEAMMTLGLDDSLNAAAAAGDPEAMVMQRSRLKHRRVPGTVSELPEAGEHDLERLGFFLLAKHIPPPGEGFDDIPKFEDPNL